MRKICNFEIAAKYNTNMQFDVYANLYQPNYHNFILHGAYFHLLFL